MLKNKIFLILYIFFNITNLCLASENSKGKELFERTCNQCHTINVVLNTGRDKEAWAKTIKRMSGKISNMLLDKDIDEVAKYLSGLGNNEQKIKEKNSINDIKSEKVNVDDFIKPEVCAKCHSEIFKQWSGSMHSKAFADPIWQATTKLFNQEITNIEDVLEMKMCVKCHTPLGFRANLIFSPKDDYAKLSGLPAQGIFCNWCHNIDVVKHIGNAEYEVTSGKGEADPSTMLGPFKDANSDLHPSKYSELHTKSEFCGLCHNVSHVGNNLAFEQTYDEWENSPYNTGNPETTINCQDCHMRQKPGLPITGKTKMPNNPGKAADNGPDREHIWTHYFVGANSIVPKLLGSDSHAEMAIERLLNAADLEIIKVMPYRRDNFAKVQIKVINSGAGHYLPTGITVIRQMWLDVVITDKKGKVLFKSGFLDNNGEVDKDAVMYNTILGDESGNPVLNVAIADRVLSDNRIPPKGYKIETYYFKINLDTETPLKVEATLKYRSISPALVKKVLNDKAPDIPAIDMVTKTDKIDLEY